MPTKRVVIVRKSRRDNLPERLQEALQEGLAEVGIKATVETERVKTTRLVRALVIAAQFRHMDYLERQEVLWRIVRDSLPTDDQRRVSIIMAVTPDDVGTD